MLANRKALVIFFDTLFHGIRKAIPNYGAEAMRKNVATDKSVGLPVAIVKRMNIGEQKNETPTPAQAQEWPHQRGLFRSIMNNLATSQTRF